MVRNFLYTKNSGKKTVLKLWIATKKLGSLEQIMNKANLLVVAVALGQECKIITREE